MNILTIDLGNSSLEITGSRMLVVPSYKCVCLARLSLSLCNKLSNSSFVNSTLDETLPIALPGAKVVSSNVFWLVELTEINYKDNIVLDTNWSSG